MLRLCCMLIMLGKCSMRTTVRMHRWFHRPNELVYSIMSKGRTCSNLVKLFIFGHKNEQTSFSWLVWRLSCLMAVTEVIIHSEAWWRSDQLWNITERELNDVHFHDYTMRCELIWTLLDAEVMAATAVWLARTMASTTEIHFTVILRLGYKRDVRVQIHRH